MEKKMERKQVRSEGGLACLDKRPPRSEVVTEMAEPPESHWRAVHLRMVSRIFKAQKLETWVTVSHSDPAVYVGLSFACKDLPLLKGPHITIGQFTVERRVNMTCLIQRLEWLLNEHAPDRELAFELVPYGRGFNWELDVCTPLYWLCRELRSQCQGFMEGKWLPSFHITWHL